MDDRERVRRALCTLTSGAWGMVLGTLARAYVHVPLWFALIAFAAVGLAWYFAFDALWPPRNQPRTIQEPSPSEHTQDGGERRGLDPDTVPQWERELLERQAQEIERDNR